MPVTDRRLLLRIAAGALALPRATLANEATDLTDIVALLRAYRRLRYSAGGGLSFWWMRATKYGLVDHRLTPLFGMEIGSFSRTRSTGPESFAATTLEVVFFTNLETGRRTEAVLNPYTGKSLPRDDSLVGPTTINFSPAGTTYPAALAGVKFDIRPSLAAFAVEGDEVWLRDDTATTVSGTAEFHVTDMSTYHCRRADLENAALDSVPGDVNFSSVTNWLGWMQMGDRPGDMLSRASGRKFERLADLPDSYLRILRERHPDLARDPAAALDRPPFRFAP